MATKPRIEFWLEYASTYSYLSVARIGRLADERGFEIDWQPFWLHPVREQGLGERFCISPRISGEQQVF